jgi:catechol 2,3-dioxygenase-like lactoylglutathione lyase family enzyme
VPQLDAIGIVCSDLVRTRAFYGLLGIEFGEGDDHVEATMPNGLRSCSTPKTSSAASSPTGRGRRGTRSALAFACGSPAEVDGLYAQIVEDGFEGEKEPWDAFWGHRYAQVRDPDGVPVDLFARSEPRRGGGRARGRPAPRDPPAAERRGVDRRVRVRRGGVPAVLGRALAERPSPSLGT